MDLLIRAACENGFAPSMSDKLLGLPHSVTRYAPDRNRYGITPEVLATLLGNHGGPKQLIPLLHDDLPPQEHLRPFFDTWLSDNVFSKGRRVSPRALRKRPFLRAIWRIWPVGFDPETKEILIKDCPVCQQRLSTQFMGDIWCCDHCVKIDNEGELCAVDLREYEQRLVAQEHWQDLDFATCFIDPAMSDHRRMQRSRLHPDFESLNNGEVFEFIHAIARTLPGSVSPACEVPPENLATAASIVRGWPTAFEQQYAGILKHDRLKRNYLIHNSRLKANLRARMSEILRVASVRNALAGLPEEQSTATAQEYRLIRNLITRGALEGDTKTNTEAIVLRARLDIRDAAESFGISVPSFMAMSDGELFPSQPASDVARSMLPSFTERLVSRIKANSQRSAPPKYAIRLPRALSSLFIRAEDPWSSVVRGILSGKIRYWKTDRSGASLLEKIYISELDELREVLSGVPATVSHLHTIPLSTTEAGRWTRLQEAGLAEAVERGLVAPPLTSKSIAKFLTEYEPSTLLSARYLPCKDRRMLRPMLESLIAAGIKPIPLDYTGKVTIWRRAEVENHFGADLITCIL
ncbi:MULTISPECIES: hypothetical protein [unclassified Rhizobium]|uniref:hypothetical protein n=1 Tax=unclassified Rhizobium TaxID=2613769 RepID=UPI0011AB87D7|nr:MULTISPECIES: hypothetical protein [unclassified Rhizobium]